MAREIIVDFNVLPRATRERLADCTGPAPKLAPLFADKASQTANFWWIILGLICVYGLVKVAAYGFGSIGFEDAVQGPGLLLVYGGAVFLLAASVLGVAFQNARRKALPFHPGRYLFPLDFIDARSRQLRIISLSELVDFKAVHHHTNGGYTHTAFTFSFQNGRSEDFSVRGKDEAEARLQKLQQSRAAFGKAVEQQDVDTIHHYDVFFDVRTKGGFEAFEGKAPSDFSGGMLALEMPRAIERRWSLALAAGVVLGGGLWLGRNLLSDHVAFSTADTQGTAGAYHAYLGNAGWLHADKAKELGAKANFSECEQKETEECWKEYVDRWSESPRLKEAREDRLPRAALKEASGTVSGVRDFRKRYPDSVVDAEAKARIHELFTQALAEFQKQASPDNPELVPFVGKLLAHLEATENPTVLVRFRREESESLQMADKILSEVMNEEGKPMAKASPYFDDTHTRPLEDNIAEALSKAFKQIFPTDLLSLEKGPALTATPEAEAATPALGIVYTVGWSGSSYRSEKGGRQFVGIEFGFDAGFSVPKEKPLNFSLTVHPPERFSVEYTRYMDRLSAMNDEGPGDGLVYQIMALRAFDELGLKLGHVFFRADSEAFLAGDLGTPDEDGGEEEDAPPPPPKKKGPRAKKATGTASNTPP